MTMQGTTRWLAVTAVTVAIGWGGAASAGTIQINFESFTDGGDAFSALDDFRKGQKDYVAEDFEGFRNFDDDGKILTGELADGGLVTSVGRFGRGPLAEDGTGNCNGRGASCSSPGVLTSDANAPNQSPFNGRANSTDENTNNPGNQWLDSNDVSQVVWEADLVEDDIDLGNGQKISGLGVILTDVADVGATFEIQLEGRMETATQEFSGLRNGTFTVVTALFRNFAPPITGFKATFQNTTEGSNTTGDGFGIDDATLVVPVPATLGLLGLGLVGLGAAARRRRED
mgnify:CR=1 FL=1